MKTVLYLFSFIFSIYIIFFRDKNDFQLDSDNYDHCDVEIIGLNSYEKNDLEVVKNVIEKFYGLKCEISKPDSTEYKSKKFHCEKAQNEFGNDDVFRYDSGQEITIYVTDFDLYSNDLNIRGICYGNQIYIQSDNSIKITTIHEISHSFGLEHCDNECIMNSFAFKRWDDLKDEPIFCDYCKSKLP